MSNAAFALVADADTRMQATKTSAWRQGTKPRDAHQRRIGRLLMRLLGTGYRDSLFERPDLVEDDYYRFINQPRGW